MTRRDEDQTPERPNRREDLLGRLVLTVVPVAGLGPADKAAIVRLCSEALAVDCGNLFDLLSASTHVLAHLDGRLVGHACWTTRWLQPAGLPPLRAAWVDAVCVAPSLQNRGIGSEVMRRLADESAGFELGALGTERLSFYEHLGWEPWRGPSEGVLHDPLDALMILRTATAPPLDTAVPLTATESPPPEP